MLEKTKQQQGHTIKKQIFSGYIVVIVITILLLLVSSLYLVSIQSDYKNLQENRANQIATQEAITKHYEWLELLNESLQSGQEFRGSLDPTKCSLGQWLSSLDDKAFINSSVEKAVAEIRAPHDRIHTSASEILRDSQEDPQAAYQRYLDEIQPDVMQVIGYLTTITNEYKSVADQSSQHLESKIKHSVIISLAVGLVGIVTSLVIANRSAGKISEPIKRVALWSKEIAQGVVEDRDYFQGIVVEGDSEIGVMMQSFQQMAQSIQDYVNVIQRIAEGDMTAFVNVRSTDDSLGKNLYHLIQSNDLAFARIVGVAESVASNAREIANASTMLADNASAQAAAVQELSDSVEKANTLVKENVQKTQEADEISQHIRSRVHESNEQMRTLLTSVTEIQDASEKISTVIKAIDEIAFQTNILSLNAAVEAAHAGEAGKGFAVVATEVRQLALRSAQAAKDSKDLIENSINKAIIGSEISNQAFTTFMKIIEDLDHILNLISNIAQASEQQSNHISDIHEEILHITQVVSGNAAASEESAAASHSMNENAARLRREMERFTLRKREQGKAYIPPEKAGDSEFIREANENYQRFLESNQPSL